MDIVDALAQALHDVGERKTKALAELQSAQSRIDRLDMEERGLEAALDYHRNGGSPVQPDVWIGLARSQAILKMMDVIGKQVSPAELVRNLKSVGRDDNAIQVSASLAYLHREHRIETRGRGAWVLAKGRQGKFSSDWEVESSDGEESD